MGPHLLSLFLSFAICKFCKSTDQEVNFPLGKVIGKRILFEDIPVFTFQSIPYAKPPIGSLRFKKPEPIEAWSQSLQADHLPPGCIQYSPNPFPWLDDLPGKTEDCLYLNIWKPATANETNKKTVMFFIHGGGFRISSSRLDYFDGRVLASLGDVIVVTINYRLGPMGFLYSATKDAPGNMGLYDILEALKWVHSNIEFFGGNKDSITVFGQSSGAIAIGMFMTSPLAQGLFSRAIMDSGSAANLDGEDSDEDFYLTQNIARAVGCATDKESLKESPETVISCLKNVDGLTLSKALSKVSTNPQRSLYPRFGDEILPHNARLAFIKGNFTNIDLLIGSNSNEGATMVTKAHTDVFGFFGEKEHGINKTYGESLLRSNFKNSPNADVVIEHYLKNVKENEYDEILYQVQASFGDFARICPSVYLAETISGKSNEVYFYFFQHRPSVSPWAPWMGVAHFDETPFAFGYPLRYRQNYTDSECALSRMMVDIWTSFAKTGKPSLQPWPLYSKENHLYHALRTDENAIGIGPHLNNCKFFRKYFGF